MRRVFAIIVAILVLSGVAVAQAAVRPPQPNYNKYGSYSRQMIVYENTQRQLNELELEKYRRFRDEVARRTVAPTYVVLTRYNSEACRYRCNRSR